MIFERKTRNCKGLQWYYKRLQEGFMEELIKKFDKNINRIRNANQYFKNNKGNQKAELELQNIINNCNDICNELQGKGYDISKLDMDIT